MTSDLAKTTANAVKILYFKLVDGAELCTKFAIEIGGLLIEQKKTMPAGEWHSFVQNDLPFSMQGANRFIDIHANRKKLKELPFGLLATKIPDDEPTPEPKKESKPVAKKAAKKKESNPEPDKPAEICDMAGVPVPENILAYFLRADEIRDMIRQLAIILKTCKQAKADNDELYQYLKLEPVQAMINDAKRSLRFALPYAVCPYCMADADNRNCKACNFGTGWVSEQIYKATPEDLKGKQNG